MHQLLQKPSGRREFKRRLPELQRLRTRHIHRPSLLYWRLLSRSTEPVRLRSTSARDAFLRKQLANGLCPQGVVEQEVRQLMMGDIPIFHGPAGRARDPLSEGEFEAARDSLRRVLDASVTQDFAPPDS